MNSSSRIEKLAILNQVYTPNVSFFVVQPNGIKFVA